MGWKDIKINQSIQANQMKMIYTFIILKVWAKNLREVVSNKILVEKIISFRLTE